MPTPSKIIVLGGGTGGTLTANRLRRAGRPVEITVIDQDDRHVYQPGLLFVPFGLAQLDDHRPDAVASSAPVSSSATVGSTASIPLTNTVFLADGPPSPTTCSSSPPGPGSSRRRPRG